MSSQLKRMTFSIYMDPGALESDRYAVGVLQNWYQRARKIQDGSEEFDFSRSRFHKDIYLSGMFMYVLSPNLCKVMANALGPEQVTLPTLHHAFASCGFTLGHTDRSDLFVDGLSAQVAALLGERLAASAVDGAGEGQLAALQQQVQQLSRQLEEQSTLIREQQRLLRQWGGGAAPVQSGEEPRGEDLSGQVARMKTVKTRGIF